ncbi:MAG: CRISPR-associated endonuclease Cas1 [Thaumarchaeota archaeon]|nr:CRISPR-associated endonuclease Cas1 [Nitrososphaerota archaeon]
MTLKGQKNYYNVKFLRGYGFSINIKDSKIILKNHYDQFSEPEIESWFVKDMPYDRIVLQGKGYISTESLSLLSENNRTVILLDNRGNPVTFCSGMRNSLTATKYRMAQYDTFRDKAKTDYLTKQILKAKLESQIRFLKSTGNSEILANIHKLERSGISEAVSSRYYFDCFAKLIDNRFEFTKRNSIRIEKKNATDVINALLNYGYSVLAGQISAYINGVGLDAYYGFMHKNHVSFQSLVYDMMEPFRWLVDYSVWKISDAKSKNRISRKQYSHSREGNVVLEYDLIRKFLELLERTFQKERQYEYKHGAFTKDGLKSVQEITIAKIMVQNLAEYCLDKHNFLIK